MRIKSPLIWNCTVLRTWTVVMEIVCIWMTWTVAGAPVSCYLYVQSHLDIEQVLILPQVLSHLALQVPQLGIQVTNGVLLRWKSDRNEIFSQSFRQQCMWSSIVFFVTLHLAGAFIHSDLYRFVWHKFYAGFPPWRNRDSNTDLPRGRHQHNRCDGREVASKVH